jgi:hypothetical protein
MAPNYHHRDPFHPRRIHEFFVVCCPASLSSYASLHLDTLSKILNHVLVITAVVDTCLFVSSWSVAFLPRTGFSTTFCSLLLCLHSGIIWMIVNNHRMSSFTILAATDFNVGLALGLSIGATVLAFSIWSSFRLLPSCQSLADDYKAHRGTTPPSDTIFFEYTCGSKRGTMSAVWFWSGLVFWLKFVTSLLLSIGRNELTLAGQYENISMNDYEDHFERFQQLSREAGIVHANMTSREAVNGAAFGSVRPSQAPAFVGDYSSVPEIRPDESVVANTIASGSLPALAGMHNVQQYHQHPSSSTPAQLNQPLRPAETAVVSAV